MADEKAKTSDTERVQRPWHFLLNYFDEQEIPQLMRWLEVSQQAAQKRWDMTKKMGVAVKEDGEHTLRKKRTDAANATVLRTLATLGVIAARFDLKKGEKHGND